MVLGKIAVPEMGPSTPFSLQEDTRKRVSHSMPSWRYWVDGRLLSFVHPLTEP